MDTTDFTLYLPTHALDRNLTDRLAEAEQLGLNLAKTIPSLDVDMDCDSPRHAHQASTESLARLLSAIERLRGERDSAKGDLSFALTEMRFANEAREAERAAAGARDNELRAQLARASTYADIVRRKDEYIRRSNLAATASFVALGYLQSKALIAEDESNIMSAQLTGVQALLEDARKTCATRERMIAGMTEEISSLEIRFNVTSLDLEAAVAQRTNLFSQIKRLEAKEVEWAVEARRAKMAQQQAEETSKQHAAQLVETAKALEQVESQRDSLNLHLTNIQADLEAAQKQLASAEGRYSALQSQRLASMSSSQVTQAMRQQIEDLEDRVLRRTEQIGIQQHDIRRLETNLKLQEERLGEMTEELDMMRAEKQAMVEDCADAREARDDAVQRLEVLEVEAESREEQLSHIAEQLTQRNLHLGTMVELIAGTAPRAKAAAQSVRRSFGMPQKAEANYAQAIEDLKQLCEEYERDARLLDDKTSAVEALEARLSTSDGEIRQMTFDLAAARTQLQVLQQTYTEVKTGAKALEDKMDVLTRESSETSTVLDARICELRSQVRQLEDEKDTILARHESVVQELRTQLETVQADTSSEDELRLLQAKHTEELRSLQDHLDQTTMELAEAKRLCADSQKLHDEQHNLVEELSGATEVLKSRVAELADKSLIANQQLDEATSGHQKQTQELQIQLDEATKALQDTERKLRDETESRATDKEAFSNELQHAAEQCRLAESLQEELRQQVTNTRKSLEALTQERYETRLKHTRAQI
jgi:chromosome segregation ATPase